MEPYKNENKIKLQKFSEYKTKRYYYYLGQFYLRWN